MSQTLTPGEARYCAEIADRLERACSHLNGRTLGSSADPVALYAFLSTLRQIQGNLSNDVTFVANLLAKRYLQNAFGVDFDAAAKAQGAPGLDIDVLARDGSRIVAEVKTTVPYQPGDFGAQQAASFKRDFAKLVQAEAKYRFLFVSEPSAFEVVTRPKYTKLIPGVRIVSLSNGAEHGA
jgi:hypothetical protein